MVICIIAEGSYPYITGGVSSWIHQLISELDSIDFKILSIMPDYKKEISEKYEIPENVIEVKTVFLNDLLRKKEKREYKLIKNISIEDKEEIKKLFHMDTNLNFKKIFEILGEKKYNSNSMDLLKSNIFWDVLKEVYDKNFFEKSFNEFFWTYRSMFISIMNLFQEFDIKADIYHSVSTGYAGFLGALLKYKYNAPYIITEHGIYPREREEEIIKSKWVSKEYKDLWIDYFYFISKVAYFNVDKIITLFNKNLDIQHKIGASKEKTEIIPNGVNLDKLNFLENKTFNKEKLIIGSVLRVVPIKDVMTLIRAFKILTYNLENVYLKIIGPLDEDPKYYKQCKDLVNMLKLNEKVEFTGKVDVFEYYKEMDCLVLTSISEGQPLVILEAMSVGLPIVATDVGACREMIRNNDNEPCGYITELVSPSNTAEKIIKIFEDKDRYQKFRINGRKRVEKFYSKNKFINSYKEVYNKLGG
ncbi:MAG: GT4 family glycosyltransferase PelF, partial [Bacillota bacterium]